MKQIRQLQFQALAILIVLAVIDIIIAFEAGRRCERKKHPQEPRVTFHTSEASIRKDAHPVFQF